MRNGDQMSRDGIVGATQGATQARGQLAEALAAHHLEVRGVRILARNVRCRGGEVDLIGLEQGVVTFIEVRLRSNPLFGGAAASITEHKRRRVELAARWWLAGAGRLHAARPCRFDAVLLSSLDEASIDWIRGAFDAAAS